MFRTDHNTGRFQTKLSAMRAIVALGCCVAVGINIERIIGASLHTQFAANAPAGVRIHNAIFPFVKRSCGTDFDTGSIITVVTTVDQEIAA